MSPTRQSKSEEPGIGKLTWHPDSMIGLRSSSYVASLSFSQRRPGGVTLKNLRSAHVVLPFSGSFLPKLSRRRRDRRRNSQEQLLESSAGLSSVGDHAWRSTWCSSASLEMTGVLAMRIILGEAVLDQAPFFAWLSACLLRS